MEVVCQKCKSKFSIADEKVPSGRTVAVKCPKCEARIEIDAKPKAAPAPREGTLQTVVDEVGSGTYDPAEKPFHYVRKGMQTALLCEDDQETREKIRGALQGMDYHTVEAPSVRAALKYMRFHVYDLVVLNETFETGRAESNYVLQYLAQLPMDIRRNILVVLLGHGLRTMDSMTAFNRSVNLVVDPTDVDDMENILKSVVAEHEDFYRVFKESLKKTGRA